MRALVMNSYGAPDVLAMAELPVPEPGPGEVLIAVAAVAVNPADGKWRSGMFESIVPIAFPHVLGYDVSGTVVRGEGFPPGARVVAMLDAVTKGGYAEYVAVAASHVVAIPTAMAFETAAAIPTAALTGLQVVDRVLDLQPGQVVLVTGALGAVGSVAVYAALGRGARVIAAVRADQAEAARGRGVAEVAILGTDWAGAAFDHVVDTLGGAEVAALARHVRPGGRIITVATTPIPADGLPAIPEFYGVVPDGADLARMVAAVAAGDLPMKIGQVLPLSAGAAAQIAVERGATGGKVILVP